MRAKLTAEQVLRMRQEFPHSEDTVESLARRYGVTSQAIMNALTGDSWRHLPGALDRTDLYGRWGVIVRRGVTPPAPIIAGLRARGYSKVSAIGKLMERLDLPLEDAAQAVHETW